MGCINKLIKVSTKVYSTGIRQHITKSKYITSVLNRCLSMSSAVLIRFGQRQKLLALGSVAFQIPKNC